MTIYFLTSNPDKRAELDGHLAGNKKAREAGLSVAHAGFDVQEILHADIKMIVRQKALDAHRLIRHPCLVEHSGLFMSALPGLPGGLGRIIWDCVQDRLCGFLRENDAREAVAKSFLGYCDGRTIRVFEGQTAGTIAERARGAYLFGWDPIFIPEGSAETYGEMGREKKAATSPMRKALDEFVAAMNTDN